MLEVSRTTCAASAKQGDVGSKVIQMPMRANDWPQMMPQATGQTTGSKGAADVNQVTGVQTNLTKSAYLDRRGAGVFQDQRVGSRF